MGKCEYSRLSQHFALMDRSVRVGFSSGTYPVTAMVFKKFYLSNCVQQWGLPFSRPYAGRPPRSLFLGMEQQFHLLTPGPSDPKNVPKMLIHQPMVTGNSNPVGKKGIFWSALKSSSPWVYVTIGETNGSTVKKLLAILCSDPNINNVQHFQGTLLNKHVLRCVQDSFPFLLPVHISIAALLGCVAQYGSTNWRWR